MLHWNSWWVRKGDTAGHSDIEPPLLPLDPSAWTPEGWLAWQFKLWDQSWQASLAWWSLYGVTVPAMSWPPTLVATTIVQPDEAPATPRPARISPPTASDSIEAPAKPRARAIASRRSGRVAESHTPPQPQG